MTHVLLLLATATGIGFAVTTLANTATTVYLHRSLSHRGLTLSVPVSMTFRTVIWLTTGIKPRQWVAVHRKHHAHTDEDGDPHSPVILGWRTVQAKNVALYRAALRDNSILDRYARDLPDDRWDRMFFNHKNTGLLTGTALLMVVFGPLTGFLAAVAHANLYLAGNAAVNALGHHFGRRPYANKATNLQWLAFLTMGEGLHNNHHAAPSSARLSHRRSEIDPGWWVIRTLMSLRLVTLRFADIRLAPGSVIDPASPR
jgi:stearoyl-CoA desaturase (delta-9 desaturase)